MLELMVGFGVRVWIEVVLDFFFACAFDFMFKHVLPIQGYYVLLCFVI